MREIKFRGQVRSDKLWEFGSLWIDNDEYCIKGTDREWWKVIPETVGQFTGIYDKNGKEIYEGDFVLLKGQKCLISFSETSGAWSISYPVRDDYDFPLENLLYWWYYMGVPDIEVIGNIHDKE